ncbi:hypothetical protein CJ030_MR4G016036 [Morella rubra]|uniref:Protein NIM1-INTERACTING 1 n=1 Tax=Morella rubra TaxID=262757 RepID=A0A6A1VVJ0_9ROSI|nr:hypothetical protein CJ030_MR4G016036 [Morella rubra]
MEDDSSLRNGEGKHDDNEEDQVKMEKFYALIRSFREAQNYYKRKELNELEKKNKNKKIKRVGGDEQLSCWVPKFGEEDFTEDIEFRRPLIFLGPCNKEKDKKARH